MGRNTGHLALYSGMAGAAAIILIPESPFDIGQVVAQLERRSRYARYDILVVAEGAKTIDGSEKSNGGIGRYLEAKLKEMTGREVRYQNPGHQQRGAYPNAFDTVMGRLMALHAVRLVKDKQFGYMVSRQNGRLTEVALNDVAASGFKKVPAEQYDSKRLNASRSAQGFMQF